MTENNKNKNNNSSGFEASLADLRLMARLHKQQLGLSSLTPPGPQSDEPQAPLTEQPLELAKDQPDPRDTHTTQALLDAYKRDDGWHCPKCGQPFTEPTTFAQHLIDELNRGLSALPKPYIDAQLSATPGPTKPKNTRQKSKIFPAL